MLELCTDYNVKIEKEQITELASDPGYLSIGRSDTNKLTHHPYTKILRLSQDVDFNNAIYERSRQAAYTIRAAPVAKLTSKNMMRALDRQ